jgi:hypothetical protein
MTGSLSGELAAFRARKAATRGSRGKKVYGITSRGEALFEELLAAESQSNEDERTFNLRLAFARYLPPDARLGMLERRRLQMLERLVTIRSRVKAVRDGYARSLVEHDREAAEHDLSWIERLFESERSGRHPDVEPGLPDETEPAGRGALTRRPGPVVRKGRAVKTRGVLPPSISGLRPHPQQEESTT